MEHRCTGPAADHCRICSFLPDPDDGPQPVWVIRMPQSTGDAYFTGFARGGNAWSDDERHAKRFDCASHAHQFLAEHLADHPAEVVQL